MNIPIDMLAPFLVILICFNVKASGVSFVSCQQATSLANCAVVSFNEELLPGTVVNTFIYNDTSTEPLLFTLSISGINLLNVSYLSLNTRSFDVDIVVSSRIDHEDFIQHGRELILTITVIGSETIKNIFYTSVIDIDDVYPVFLNASVTCEMLELDPDQSCPVYMESDQDLLNSIVDFTILSSTTGDPADFDVTKYSVQVISNIYISSYVISLKKALDYSLVKNVQVVVKAKDSANHITYNSVYINVKDVANKPPLFLNLPYIVRFEEALPLGSTVAAVTVIDGDTGIKSPILYSFNYSQFNQYFDINPNTGIITMAKTLVRESPDILQVHGLFNLTVIASKNEQIPLNTSTTTVTVQIVDINNYPAVFSPAPYNASVQENCLNGTTVIILPNITAQDLDLGDNAAYIMSVIQNGNISSVFDIYPKVGLRTVLVSVVVINGQSLDYETIKSMNVTIQAKQVAPVKNINTTSYINLSINLIDVNDNAPQFTNTSYTFSINEHSPMYTSVGPIQATDRDSGIFGTVSYNLSDPLKIFSINSTTGSIFVNANTSSNILILNITSVPSYYIFGVAIDGGGLMAVVGINIVLLDINDNPPIFQSKIYNSSIRENSLVLIPGLLQVKATDADVLSTNKLIAYALVNITNDDQSFLKSLSMDVNTGIVTVVNPIDREALNKSNGNILTILVTAFDPTKIIFVDFCSITLNVQDVNDNAPILSGISYNATIQQNTSSDSVILYINATDLDQPNSLNSEISYKLVGGGATKFIILPVGNSSKGAFITKDPNAQLDVQTYNFTVEADDHGTPSLNSTAIVLITVTEVNSHNPVFAQQLYQYIIYKNISTGTSFGQLVATDADPSANLSYMLLKNDLIAWNSTWTPQQPISDIANSIGVNSSTGILMITAPLDRDKYIWMQVIAIVVDLAAQKPGQTASATIQILVKDVNANPPVFISPVFNLNIYEDSSIKNNLTTGATGLFTLATDKDSMDVLRYSMDGNQSFIIDSSTGQIFLIKSLDREKVAFINFTVTCSDGVFVISTTVIVTVLDINDNEPTFTNFNSSITIYQNTSVGAVLLRLNASDLDIGENARLQFQIKGGETAYFALSTNGTLTLAQSLLQNPTQMFTIFIEVFDNPNGSYHLRSDREMYVNVIVTNRPPYFNQPYQNYTIPENVLIGFKVDEITATDIDSGPNGVVNYFFNLPSVNPNPISLTIFKMNENYGRAQIFVNASLKYKAGNYALVLRAVDKGTPPLDSNFTLFINVTSINYIAPNFTNPVLPSGTQSIPSFSIKKNVVGIISTINAYDPDEDLNGLVRYSLPNAEMDNSNFSIDPINGTFINKVAFDRKLKTLFKCRIQANDLGTPSLTSFILVQVIVLEPDNNSAIFKGANKTITLSVTEGPQSTTQINNTLMVGFRIGNVARAVNNDANENICYFLMTNMTTLYLVPTTGDLYGLQPFNRAAGTRYQMGIKALTSDQCIDGPLFVYTKYNITDPSEALLTLLVTDINSNPPVFTSPMIVNRIPKYSYPGMAITDLSTYTIDVDVVSQGRLVYWILGNVSTSSPLNTQMRADNIFSIFTINSTSGVISLYSNVFFLNTMEGYFQMTVAVSDGKFNATTSYMAYLVGQYQVLAIVVNNFPSNITNQTDDLALYCSKQLNVTIYIDEIGLCSDIYMNLIVGCTNIYIYGLNSSTNMVISGADLLKKVTAQASSMTDLYRKYQVSSFMLGYRNISGLIDNSATTQAGTYKLILIIVSCIFLLIIIIACAGLYIFRYNYQRELKAFTTSSSDHTTILKTMGLPGTNLYENSNNPFAQTSENDNYSKVLKYGAPGYTNGITLEGSTSDINIMQDETQIIDGAETIF